MIDLAGEVGVGQDCVMVHKVADSMTRESRNATCLASVQTRGNGIS